MKVNRNEQLFNTERNVLFRQDIQLRHISCGQFKTLNLKHLLNEYGWFKLKLSYCNELWKFKFIQSQEKISKLNEPISYEVAFIINNSKEKTGYFLHWNPNNLYIDLQEERKKMVHSVNASHGDLNLTQWMVNKYFIINVDQTDQEKSKITTMDTVRFFHREIGGYLTVTRWDVQSNLPKYPDFLKKEIAILAEKRRS